MRNIWSSAVGFAVMAVWGVASLMSPDRASALGKYIMRGIGPRLPENKYVKTHRLRGNLTLAFPERTSAEIKRLVRDVWGSIGAVFAEYPHLQIICGAEAAQRIQTDMRWRPVDENGARKPAIFAAAHLSNWELAAAAIVGQGIPLSVVHTEQPNRIVERMLRRYRRALGCKFITKADGMRSLVREIRSGRSIGLLVDQRVDSGELLPFFGIDSPTSCSPARLALRHGCDLVPVRVERLQGVRFRVTLYEPIDGGAHSGDERQKSLAMTRELNRMFEDWIRAQPHEWMCSKRRWPKRAIHVSGAVTASS